jgi:hypothetical protein
MSDDLSHMFGDMLPPPSSDYSNCDELNGLDVLVQLEARPWDALAVLAAQEIKRFRAQLAEPGSADNSPMSSEDYERSLLPNKAVLSEFGWIYLINDSNRFVQVQCGELIWSEADSARAAATLAERRSYARSVGASYHKFIVPEKSVVYPEYLPAPMQQMLSTQPRPAQIMQATSPHIVSYLDQALHNAKALGLVYFRGDTHTNWLGAWVVYRQIIMTIKTQLDQSAIESPFDLRKMQPVIAAYDGDLFTQVDFLLLETRKDVWYSTASSNGFEAILAWQLPPQQRKANQVAVPEAYTAWFKDRKTYVYERSDKQGLRAVVFHDSTLDHCLDLVAQHFARTVFVWEGGHVFEDVIEAERPDIIIHVMAERFVARYHSFPATARVSGVA